TGSADFPVTADAADSSFNGTSDIFLAKINATGSALLYGSFWGGLRTDSPNDLVLDPGGNVFVAGQTSSIDFPRTQGGSRRVLKGGVEGFVVRFAPGNAPPAPPAPPPTPAAPTLSLPINGDTPAQPLSFSWNVATGALTYEIQIDDSSAFTAPLVRDVAGLTVPQYATTDLAAVTHFWRVRGVNSAGVPGPFSAVRSFTPQAAPPPPGLSTMSTNPSSVVGGDSSFGTVVLSTSAPSTGAVISLTSSNPTVAAVPATTTAPALSFTADFTIATSPVTVNTTITITATYNGRTRTATLLVVPVPPPPSLASVLVSPATVQGQNTTNGIVTLANPAPPPAGATVFLSSSNPTVAIVPTGVSVFPGQTSQTFTVSTTSVSVSTPVTISATLNDVTLTAPLTITPIQAPPPPPPPPAGGTATLTVSATGRSGERVSSSPAGISFAVGSSGSATFNSGTSITLSVSNTRVAIWSGACSSGGNKVKTCTFTIQGDASVTANVQ